MAEGLKALDDLASSIANVDKALTKFDESKLKKVSDSKKWTALSRMVSGILPGFWSFQNKIRGFIDILYMLEQRQHEQLKAQVEAAKQIKTIHKNYKDAQKVVKSLAFDENRILELRKEKLKIEKRMENLNQSKFVKELDQKKLDDLNEQLDMYDAINDKAKELGLTTKETLQLERAKAKELLASASPDYERTGGKLKQQLDEEIMVKRSEVLMNYDLKCYNKKLEIQINELVRINEDFLDKLAKIRLHVESLLEK